MVMKSLQMFINKILFLKKRSLFQFQGVKFYPSEIHLLLIVRDKNATNATKMAGELGVTKGAVSQTLSRLEKKGVLKKTKDPYKKNELTLSFTTFGAAAFKHYSAHATRLLKKHNRYLDQFTDKEKAIVQRFLTEAEKVFDEIA
jgi:DNA-binding MarR family transcriptional regulator